MLTEAPRDGTARGAQPYVVAGAALVALTASAGYALGSLTIALLGPALVALAGLTYLGVYMTPALLFSLSLAFEVLNGNAGELGFPLAPDRIFFAAGIASLVLGLPGSFERYRSIVWRPIHALLAATAMYAAVSALSAGTLTSTDGLFALLDRLGVVPFLMFTLAPIVYGDRRSRDTLLTVMVGLGAYLGFTAIAEAVGWRGLVFPSYINDPSVGIHYGRSRGPFAEAVGNGLGLYGCAVASATAFYLWSHRPRARVLALAVTVLCLVGTIFTLTRAIWLATVMASLLALLFDHRTRRVLVPALGLGAVALLLALALVPGFASRAEERQGDQRPIWDRYNSNAAGLRAVRDEPLFGVGWQAWTERNDEYLRLSDEIPLTGTSIAIHNVALSHAAELGLVGLSLWAVTLVSGVGGAVLRPGPAELDPWRLGLVALAGHWFLVAAFGPLSYPFPNLLLWTWAGICSVGHLSKPLRTT